MFTVPLVQVTETGTGVTGPPGEYTLLTVKVVVVSLLVIVQTPVLSVAEQRELGGLLAKLLAAADAVGPAT